jgi:4-oxalocrotonate tautomerase
VPFLNIHLTSQLEPDQANSIARALTDLTERCLHKDPALTAVAVNVVGPSHWFVGGQSLESQGCNSFALDIKVTAGTNTKSDMARYIEAIFQTMGTLLGRLHDTSYVVIHEVPAAAWGYAGQTQEFRFIAGRIKAAA